MNTLGPTPFYVSAPVKVYDAMCTCHYFRTDAEARAYAAVHGGTVEQTTPAFPRERSTGIFRVAIPVTP